MVQCSGFRNHHFSHPRNHFSPTWNRPSLLVEGSSYSDGDEYGIDGGDGGGRKRC